MKFNLCSPLDWSVVLLGIAGLCISTMHGQGQATCPTGSTCITIPAQTVTASVPINGTTVKISIAVPAQAVPLPASIAGLPSGFTLTNGVFTIPASTITLTGGPALPTCASELFLWQFVAATGSTPGSLQPACYVAPTLSIPPIAVSQAANGAVTLTP
jgi:hypothetical protein